MLVVAEPGSRFTLVQELTSGDEQLESYVNGVVEVVVRDGAKAEIVNLQRLSPKAWLFASCHARVERDAELDWVEGGFGSARGKVWIQNDLAGRGATSRVTGAYFADGSQHLDYDTYQLHAAPDTTSDFAFKGALRDTAATVWRGMIRVEEGAQKTNAYQENRNLLLSKTATANSIPGLEILANDVRCTHGATLSQVDREQLFYLMARGLPRSDAERLIVRGFFQDVLDRIELDPVREALGRRPRGPHPAGLTTQSGVRLSLGLRPTLSRRRAGMLALVPCSCCAGESLDIFGEKGARRELAAISGKGLGGTTPADRRLGDRGRARRGDGHGGRRRHRPDPGRAASAAAPRAARSSRWSRVTRSRARDSPRATGIADRRRSCSPTSSRRPTRSEPADIVVLATRRVLHARRPCLLGAAAGLARRTLLASYPRDRAGVRVVRAPAERASWRSCGSAFARSSTLRESSSAPRRSTGCASHVWSAVSSGRPRSSIADS